jgi:hypothetical protein
VKHSLKAKETSSNICQIFQPKIGFKRQAQLGELLELSNIKAMHCCHCA